MRHRPWTARDNAFLRRHCRKGSAWVAVRLGRTRWAVVHHARALGLDWGRPRYSARLEARVRAGYARQSAPALARRLGVPTEVIYRIVVKLGLRKHQRVKVGRAFLATLRQRNRQGWPDSEIAAELGCDRHVVSRHRQALGLPSQARGPIARQRTGAAAARQLDRLGLASMGELRVQAHRAYAVAHGWPAYLRKRAVQILDLLWQQGPKTRRELAEGVGLPWRGSRGSLKSSDPPGTYLANLMALGLVVKWGRINRGGHQWETVYGLALDAVPQKEDA